MKSVKHVELALQGGGAHGAYTWGVLDHLLGDPRIKIAAISGTSAGAMNAVVMADGLQRGGRDGARQALEEFWRAVSNAARFSPIRRSFFDQVQNRWGIDASPGYLGLSALLRLASTSQINPFDVNPLREVLDRQVDFDRVNACDALALFVTATNVRTGLPRIFRRGEIGLDTVMAFACLPDAYKAVEIDGEAYWDGGYIGNPALFPLVDETDCRDLVIVQINPIRRAELPRTATATRNRLNEITIDASLIKELRSIALLHELIEAEGIETERYRNMRLHPIGGAGLEHLSASSKLNPEWDFLLHLRNLGRSAAEEFISKHFAALGQHSTFDPATLFDGSLRDPVMARGLDAEQVA